MYALLMTLFIILCLLLAVVVLFLQQGKGDMGLGSMAGSQMLFGGSGGQELFEKMTWIMGALFIAGSLGLSILKSKQLRTSILDGNIAKQSSTSQQRHDEPVGDLDRNATDLEALQIEDQNINQDISVKQENNATQKPLSA